MNWLKEKSKKDSDKLSIDEYNKLNEEFENHDTRSEWLAEQENNMEIEKGDLLGIIISAFIVFSPIFLILFIIMVLVIIW